MERKIVLLLWALFFPLIGIVAQSDTADYNQKMLKAGLVDIQSLDDEIEVLLKYATEDNFVGQNMYGTLRKAFFRPHFAKKIAALTASAPLIPSG